MPSFRFTARYLLIAVFAFAAVGMLSAPRKASALTVRVAENAAGQSAAAAQPPAEEKSDSEKQTDAFLHDGPIVKATAKLFGVSVDAASRIYFWVNFLIIFFCVAIPLVRVAPRIFRKRSELLREKLENARKTTADANARLSAVEAKLSDLDKEIAGFRTEMESEIVKDEARIKASIEEEKQRIVASAEQEIASAADHAQRTLRNFAANLAIEQAAKQIVLTPEVDRALIAEFIDKANGKGGQN
jgi:F-type H+-transporting ATPase subunit b